MRKVGLRSLSVLMAAVALVMVASVASAGPQSPFKGLWEATDIDGSHMELSIAGGGGGRYRLNWADDYWSICDGGPGRGTGSGMIDATDPNVLDASITFRCSGSLWGTLAMDFEYDLGTDTMVNIGEGSVEWSRVRGGS